MTVRILIIATILLAVLLPGTSGFAQELVLDFDGNQYQSIVIGNQVWLQENIKSLHYSDGSEIPDVVAYNNSESNADTYGRLYTWDAAMGGSLVEGAQGICPEGWHIPSDAEWRVLENYLGGVSVAGGKLKEAGTVNWRRFNTGADNASGFTALPGGEYDSHDNPNQFRLINEYAVFWTSTEASADRAMERYLAYNSAASSSLNWYKIMKYSIRAIRDTGVSELINGERQLPKSALLHLIAPNPFNPSTTISYEIPQTERVNIHIVDVRGRQVKALLNEEASVGSYEISWSGVNEDGVPVDSGVYVVIMVVGNEVQTQKISLVR